MITARRSCFAILVLGATACAGRQRTADHLTPVAQRITIYSAGGSVVSGVVDPAVLGTRRLRLPASVTSINLSQADQRLPWFTVQPVAEAKKDKDDKDRDDRRDDKRDDPRDGSDERDAPYKLIGLPALRPGELKFDYTLPDITWALHLNADIVDGKSVSLQLVAAVTVNASEPYRNCEVTLVLNNAVSVERLTGLTFKLRAFDLYPHRNITYSLGNKTADYAFVREWNAHVAKDEVHVLLQVKNPFAVDLDQIRSTVESNQIIVESGAVSSAGRQGDVISLPAGIDDTISTFRAFKITEATDKRALPFNHQVSYEIVNRSDQVKTLRLVTARVLGNEHRSIYHFKEPPAATPDNTLVWILTLAPHATRTLEYDFDADVKDVDGENGFEQGG